MNPCLLCGHFCGCHNSCGPDAAFNNGDCNPFQFLPGGCLPEHELRPVFYRGRRIGHMDDQEIRAYASPRSGGSAKTLARMRREMGLRFYCASPLQGGRAG